MKITIFALILVAALGIVTGLNALVTDYVFTQSMETYTEISGGIVLGNTTSMYQVFVDPAIPLGEAPIPGKTGSLLSQKYL